MRQPSAEGIRAAISRRLNSVRYAVGDVLYVVGRFLLSAGRLLIRIPVSIGRGAARFWDSLSVIARRRLVAALGVAVLLLILFSAVVPNLPCQVPGGDSCPPGDDAAELVPGDALAYLHANLDPDTDEYAAASRARPPAAGVRRRTGHPRHGPDPEPEHRPARLRRRRAAMVRGRGGGGGARRQRSGAPERVDLLEVDDGDGASEYAKLARGRRPPDVRVRGG